MEHSDGAPVIRQGVVTREGAARRPGPADQGRRGGVASIGAALALPLTLLSAILFLIGFWSPWVNEIGMPRPGSGFGATMITLTNSGSDITLSGLFAFILARPTSLGAFSPLVASLYIWDALPIFGVVLAVALWRGRATPRWLVSVYAAWLLFITAVTSFGAYRAFVVLPGRPCGGNCSDPYFTFHWQIAWGVWLTLGAVVLAWVAFAALWLRRTAPGAAAGTDPGVARDDGAGLAPQTPHRKLSRFYVMGVGVFTLGVAIWAVGLYLVPWLTAGCTGIPISIAHFSHDSCMGLDGYDMLIAGLHKAGWTDALAVATAALYIVELLAVAGGVLAWLLWRPGRAFSLRAVVVVAAVWLLLVTLAFIVGWQGTAANLGQPAQLVFGARGTWVVGPGVWLCAVGILLAWAGGIVVWVGGRSGAAPPRADVHQLHVIGG